MSSVYFKCQIHMIKYITITTFQIQEIIFKRIQFKYVVYKTWGQIQGLSQYNFVLPVLQSVGGSGDVASLGREGIN